MPTSLQTLVQHDMSEGDEPLTLNLLAIQKPLEALT